MLNREAFFDTERQIFTAMRDKGFQPRGVIDIGASNGAWSRCCMQVFPDAHYRLYEPMARRVAPYHEGLDALLASRPDTVLREVGLADARGVADFYLTPNLFGSSLLRVKEAEQVTIELTTLDADTPEDFAPDVVKMDVQGGELRIIKGAVQTLQRAKLVVVETWLYRGYGAGTPLAHEIIAELEKHSLMVVAAGGPYFDDKGFLYSIDFYFSRHPFLLAGANP